MKIYTSAYTQMQCMNLGSKNYYSVNKPKFNVRTIPEDFMNSEQMSNIISQLIDDINLFREHQVDIDNLYERVLDVLYT